MLSNEFLTIKTMKNIKTKTLNRVVPTRLTDYDYKIFVATAKQQKVTTTALLRQLALEYIEKIKEMPALN